VAGGLRGACPGPRVPGRAELHRPAAGHHHQSLRGFVFAASLMGITGTRAAVSGQADCLVGRIRPHTDLPVAVSLGVSNGVQAMQVAAFVDGVTWAPPSSAASPRPRTLQRE
jgi:Tryptophan synthase alpha chain